MKTRLTILFAAFAAVGTLTAGNVFRVTPYVQHPAKNAMTLMWLAQEAGDASVSWWEAGSGTTNTLASAIQIQPTDRTAGCRFEGDGVIKYCLAPELGYGMNPDGSSGSEDDATRFGFWEMPFTVPYQYRVRLTGLKADTVYGYRVSLAGGASYSKTFRTAPDEWRPVKFIYYSDSEAEPKDNDPNKGKTSDWTDPQTDANRTYYATQTEAFAANLREAQAFGADLIVMAGDLAQKGSKQNDWDEFWRHHAGQLNDPAGSIPVLASPGNHDYWSYTDGGNTGISKYLSYFEFEPNGTAAGAKQQELFHRVDYGPVTFLFMDANNGNDAVLAEDTSRNLCRGDSGYGHGCIAPDFNPGSDQYRWLEENLRDAQRRSAFIFVVSHHCPYSVGYHGGEIHERNQGGDEQTGRALRVLEPLFHRYGVDGWLCGHDEMMERSVVTGTETRPDGTEVPHTLMVWDMGIAGDGLRGNMVQPNPQEAFRAHVNSPEIRDEAGTLVEGGKHYGQMQVEVTRRAGRWQAVLTPVYLLPMTNSSGTVTGFVRKVYDDVQTFISTKVAAVPGASRGTVAGWIDETAAALGGTGTWTPVPSTGGGKILFEDLGEGGYEFRPTRSQSGNTVTTVDTEIVFDAVRRASDGAEAQAGVFLGEVAVNSSTEKRFYLKDAEGWRPVAVNGLVPELGEPYAFRIELDYTGSPATVVYSLRRGAAYEVIHRGVTAGGGDRMSSLGWDGVGSAASVYAEYESFRRFLGTSLQLW